MLAANAVHAQTIAGGGGYRVIELTDIAIDGQWHAYTWTSHGGLDRGDGQPLHWQIVGAELKLGGNSGRIYQIQAIACRPDGAIFIQGDGIPESQSRRSYSSSTFVRDSVSCTLYDGQSVTLNVLAVPFQRRSEDFRTPESALAPTASATLTLFFY